MLKRGQRIFGKYFKRLLQRHSSKARLLCDSKCFPIKKEGREASKCEILVILKFCYRDLSKIAKSGHNSGAPLNICSQLENAIR